MGPCILVGYSGTMLQVHDVVDALGVFYASSSLPLNN